MLDGQIHDIYKVGETISEVKSELEEKLGEPLKSVCIAAAGRVLRTVTTRVDYDYGTDREVSGEDVYALDSMGVEKAYQEFQEENDLEMKFYCVGYSVVHYYMNGYMIGNLEGHKARTVGADIIATFLPEDVVDGLYKAVGVAGLEVVNLTLEPIAAIQVAIPEMYRMLNIALVDVGRNVGYLHHQGRKHYCLRNDPGGRGQSDRDSCQALSGGLHDRRADQARGGREGPDRI